MQKIYDIVKEAQQRALASVKAGINAREVDSVARDFIREKGYGGNFGHGLGHGLGYDIHEKPALNERADYVLKRITLSQLSPVFMLKGLAE